MPTDGKNLVRETISATFLPTLPVCLLLAVLALGPGCSNVAGKPVVIGAKKFTESIILADIGTRLAGRAGAEARRDDLGGTPALWLALTNGDIDAYPEYTGTITRQILKAEPPDLAAALAEHEQVARLPQQLRPGHA
jgi:osmoprotectant transport system permease protein